MKVKVLTDTTLTVKGGQIVDVAENEVPNLLQLGRVEAVKEPAPKKTTSKKASK